MFEFSKLIKISSLLSALLTVGCASVIGTFSHDPELRKDDHPIYAGTRIDAEILAAPFAEKGGPGTDQSFWAFYPFFIVDLPLSMVMDTLLLPYTIPSYYSETKQSQKRSTDTAERKQRNE